MTVVKSLKFYHFTPVFCVVRLFYRKVALHSKSEQVTMLYESFQESGISSEIRRSEKFLELFRSFFHGSGNNKVTFLVTVSVVSE